MGRRRRAMMRLIDWGARLIVGGAFVYAGWLKALGTAQLIRDIWGYRLLPEDWAYWIAAYLPYLEMIAGLALITGLQRHGARLVIGSLLVAFSLALALAWARGLDVACGCFGGAVQATTSADYALVIGRDLLMLGALALSAWADRKANAHPAAARSAS